MGCLISSQNLERLRRNSREILCSFFGKALARLLRWATDAEIACETITPVLRPWILRPKVGFFFLVLSTQTLGAVVASSLARPPALRITCASPSPRPTHSAGSTRACLQLQLANRLACR